MGKHEAPKRSQLIPVLAVIALAVALLGVTRFASAMGGSDEIGTTAGQVPPSLTATASESPTTEDPVVDVEPVRVAGGGGDVVPDKVVQRIRAEAVPPAAAFRMATFNVLGHSHTVPGGTHGGRGFAPGTTRIGFALQALRANGVSVVGLQEFEQPQSAAFTNMAGAGWRTFPGMSQGTLAVRRSIAWNTAVWEWVEGRTIELPYFGGARVPAPVIKLRHLETGREAWFINIHNPTSNARRGNNAHWRAVATQMEINQMNALEEQTGLPVFLMGDFNERNEAFCKVTAGADAQAAIGGSGGPPCQVPGGLGIDQIFGSKEGVTFSAYLRLQNELIRRASDHPMILTSVTLDGATATD